MSFLSLKPEVFGLDISDLSLKIAKLKKKGRFLGLASWGEIEIKPGVVEEGEIKNEEALAENIRKCLDKVKGEKIKTKYVVASLPEKKAFLQVIPMPKMTKEELEKAVPFEAENYVPLPIEEVYLDFQIVPAFHNHLDHFDVLIAAFPKKIVNSYLSCFERAGLIPWAMEIESQVISRALLKQEISPFPIFIIDFGRSRSSFIIFSGHSLRFTASIPISSHNLTEIISRALKVDLKEAEILKIKQGLSISDLQIGGRKNKKNIKKIEVFEAMVPVLTDLVEQVGKHINYYQTHASHEHLPPNGKRIEKIILCGRGANLKGLPDFISSELKISAELANPWINILPEPLREVPGLPFEDSLGYTTALGLALRGIINE
ncbi:MAG: type IV pilus assembly protein PilM [Candidatus Nealsonbacteria bacterium]|nr:type IV pilus assembly protein PilM [Candidatus Nealsonbacteria bacterium]